MLQKRKSSMDTPASASTPIKTETKPTIVIVGKYGIDEALENVMRQLTIGFKAECKTRVINMDEDTEVAYNSAQAYMNTMITKNIKEVEKAAADALNSLYYKFEKRGINSFLGMVDDSNKMALGPRAAVEAGEVPPSSPNGST